MPDTLLDQLAERLANAYANTDRYPFSMNSTPAAWRRVAAECLRQMRWSISYQARTTFFKGTVTEVLPTLAPPDWTP